MGGKIKTRYYAIKKDTAHLIQVHEHVKGFLEAARGKKKRIYLITNAHRKGIKLKMQVTQLQNYFDEIVSSHDFGIAKQEQEFWEHLIKVINFDRQRAIFFDDSLDVLKSASKFEIRNIVAINKPSSKIDKKVVPGFINIENFSQALPL